MNERGYFILRKFFFWLSFFAFVVFTPVIVYYSLGYKFNFASKKFEKTGAISLKTFPKNVDVYVDDTKLKELGPCVLRELLPQEYAIRLEKEGFYPYRLNVVVRPSAIVELDIVLIPKMQHVEKMSYDFIVKAFFMSKHLFGDKIIVFTDTGIFFVSTDFKDAKRIASFVLPQEFSSETLNLKEGNKRLVFWGRNSVWLTGAIEAFAKDEVEVVQAYTTGEDIRDVFLGVKDRYLIIQDGLKIIALDVQNPQVSFTIFELNSIRATIYYENNSETLYIKDRVKETDTFSLFRIELLPLLNEEGLRSRVSHKPLPRERIVAEK